MSNFYNGPPPWTTAWGPISWPGSRAKNSGFAMPQGLPRRRV